MNDETRETVTRQSKERPDQVEQRCGEAVVAAAVLAPFAKKVADKVFDRPKKERD